MKCTYAAGDGCTNETAPGSAYCAEHPLDDMNFYLRAMVGDMRCPACNQPVPEGLINHDCPGPT